MATSIPANPPYVIGAQISIRGGLTGNEDLIIEGRFEGQLQLNGSLTVAPGAHVDASVEVDRALIQGEVTGDIVATESVRVEAGARVFGKISAPRVEVCDGAHLQGGVEMSVPLPQELQGGKKR